MLINEIKFGPYSHSRIKLYDDCPFKFKLKYIDGISKFTSSPWLIRGTYYHSFLEHWPNLEKMSKRNEEWDQHLNELVNKPNIKEILDNTVKKEYPFSLNRNFEPVSKKDALITGFIDNISLKDRTLVIVDWKTGKSKADFSQLKLYSIWCSKVFKNINEFELRLSYLEQDEDQIEIYSREEINTFEHDVKTKINKIETDTTFERCISSKCNNCDYFSECNPIAHKMKRI